MAHRLQVEAYRAAIHPYITIFVNLHLYPYGYTFYADQHAFNKHIFYCFFLSNRSRFSKEGIVEFS